MYELAPPAIYAHESVMSDPLYRGRAERVAAACTVGREIVTFRDEDVPALVAEKGLLEGRVPMGTLDRVEDPVLMFNTFRFDSGGRAGTDALARRLGELKVGARAARPLGGRGAFLWTGYNQPGDPHAADKVCRPCWRIHQQQGCVHRCKYCALGGLLVAMVNVEEYCRHLAELVAAHPWQKTFLLDDDADPPCLEPELGVLGPLVEFFGTLEDRYLIIHTKTWNTEWLRGLKHNGNTIIVWSLSGRTQSTEIEPVAGTTEQRIEAARVAQEAGYQIRYKFKPIVPVVGWRRDAAEAVEMALARTRPDVISLCSFMWMDVDEMKSRLAQVADLLDPEFLRAAEASREEVADTRTRPFPHEMRAKLYEHYLAEIRRHDPRVPVSLSTENFAMWGDFRERLGMTATNYVCGCGPQCVPGIRKLADHPFRVAVRAPVELPGSLVAVGE
jgi:DNA repair photolyase